mmetsp:Transcript_82019/g.144860  ORF Transcript_82019/g.144860 Transcript_82019/m.144860 type:complete len:235 (-) Transcript_82019:727-1431(-)
MASSCPCCVSCWALASSSAWRPWSLSCRLCSDSSHSYTSCWRSSRARCRSARRESIGTPACSSPSLSPCSLTMCSSSATLHSRSSCNCPASVMCSDWSEQMLVWRSEASACRAWSRVSYSVSGRSTSPWTVVWSVGSWLFRSGRSSWQCSCSSCCLSEARALLSSRRSTSCWWASRTSARRPCSSSVTFTSSSCRLCRAALHSCSSCCSSAIRWWSWASEARCRSPTELAPAVS